MATTRKVSTAQDAQKDEALEVAEPKVITYNGKEYTIPGPLDVGVGILEAEGELALLKAILGDEQYEAWRATSPTLRTMREFSDIVVEAVGFDNTGN